MEGVRNLNEAINGGWKINALLIREGKLSDWAWGLVHTTAVKNYRLREELIRSCEAFGVDALLLTGHGVDMYDPEVITSTMGSFFRLPVMRVAENETLFRYLDVLREKYPGMRVVGSTAHRQQTVYETTLQGSLVLMIGNETTGLCQAFKAHCDELLTIPMNEESCATSFNVSCAASIMMYEVIRQRREKR